MIAIPPPVSETAAPDEFLEHIRKYRDAAMFASRHGSQQHAEQRDEHWAWIVAEISRLRAENERLYELLSRNVEKMAADSVEIERLRAATREQVGEAEVVLDPFKDRDAAYRAALAENPSQR